MGIETFIAAIAAAGSLAGSAKSIFGGNKAPASPPIAAAPVPAGPPADLTSDALNGMKPGSVNEPGFLRFSPGMTNIQKRAQIATFGTQSGDSRFSDPDTKAYYKNLLLSDYDPTKGIAGGVLPIERQYASNVLGQTPKNDSFESFLSAIQRGIG